MTTLRAVLTRAVVLLAALAAPTLAPRVAQAQAYVWFSNRPANPTPTTTSYVEISVYGSRYSDTYGCYGGGCYVDHYDGWPQGNPTFTVNGIDKKSSIGSPSPTTYCSFDPQDPYNNYYCDYNQVSWGSFTTPTGAVTLATTLLTTCSGCSTWTTTVSDSYAYTVTGSSAPTLSLAPHAGERIDVSGCIADCFESTLTYAMPEYTSLGARRSVALQYRSGRAHPMGKVELDATNVAATTGHRVALQLMRTDNFSLVNWTNGANTLYFQAAPGGTTRLVGEFDASTLATGRYVYNVIVTYVNADGSPFSPQTSAVLGVIVVNDQNSVYGAGVEIVGLQRVFPTTGGLLVTEGTGAATFFANDGSQGNCGPPTYGTCTYTAPTGEFSTLTGMYGLYSRRYPDGTTITFDGSGYETQVTDRFGVATIYSYGININSVTVLTQITDPAGIATTFLHRAYESPLWKPGTMYRIIQNLGAGRQADFGVDPNNDLLNFYDVDGTYYGFAAYDGLHRLTQFTDRSGNPWNYTYNNANTSHVASILSPTVVTNAGAVRPTTQVREPAGALLQYVMNGGGTLTYPVPYTTDPRAIVTDAGAHTTMFTLNKWNQPLVATDALNQTTIITRDANGFATQVQSSTGAVDVYRYSGPNLIMSRLDGHDSTNLRWGAFAQLDSIWGPRQKWQGFVYGPNGAIQSASTRYAQNAGTTYTSQYLNDSYGRVTRITDAAGHATRYFYNGLYGNQDSTAMAGGQWSKTIFDGFGRDSVHRMAGRYPPPTAAPIPFQFGGPLIQDQTTYDLLNRVVRYADGTHAQAATFEYGPLYLTKVRDTKGQVYRRDVNALGWVTADYDPVDTVSWSRRMSYTYGADGQIVTSTNRRGQTVSLQYDAVHRMTARTGGATADNFSYSVNGLSTSAWNAVSTDVTFLRPNGWVDSVVTTIAGQRFRVRYMPDASQRLDSLEINGSAAITFAGRKYVYEPTNNALKTIRVSGSYGATIQRNSEMFVSGIDYLAGGSLLRSRTLGFTSTHQVFSDAMQNLWFPAGYNGYYHLGFGYDSLGRVHESTPNPDFALQVHDYEYRGDQELAWHKRFSPQSSCTGYWFPYVPPGGCNPPICPAASADYGYNCLSLYASTNPYDYAVYDRDDAGNRVSDLRVGRDFNNVTRSASTTYNYDTGDRLGSLSGTPAYSSDDNLATYPGSNLTFERDFDGNVTRKYSTITDTRFGWDELGRLTTVTVPATGGVVNYDYNAFGQLVRRRTNGAADRHFLWEGDDLLAELDGGASTRIAEYVYLSTDQPLMVVTGTHGITGVDYLIQDGLGNVKLAFGVPSNAPVHFQTEYSDWGAMVGANGTLTENRLFWKGMIYMGDSTQLYYARNRWYSPQFGGFMSEDPIGLAGGMNTYAFGDGDPVNGSDAFGLASYTGGNNSGGPETNTLLWKLVNSALGKNSYGKFPSLPPHLAIPTARGLGREISAEEGDRIADAAISVALEYILAKTPYEMGGGGLKGSDCIHYAKAAWCKAGLSSIPLTQSATYRGNLNFRAIPVAEARRGDLLWQPRGGGNGHVGIYLGMKNAKGGLIGVEMGGHGVRMSSVWGIPKGPNGGGWFAGGEHLIVYRPMIR